MDLCLGTAQLGLDYGATNNLGKPTERQALSILIEAKRCGIKWLDTAPAYGSAEARIGKAHKQGIRFQVVSKLKAQNNQCFNAKSSAEWEFDLNSSLKALQRSRIWGLLVHSPKDLKVQGAEYLHEWLASLVDRQIVKKVGVSIYSEDQLEGLPDFLSGFVQLPCSLYDQRLIRSGCIRRLRERGCEIHARSLFLQGLTITRCEDWGHRFGIEEREHHKNLEDLAVKKACSLLDLSIGFAKHQPDIDKVIVGVCSTSQLNEIKDSWKRNNPWNKDEWMSWMVCNEDFIDPRKWSSTPKIQKST